jgi:hypothetical protein
MCCGCSHNLPYSVSQLVARLRGIHHRACMLELCRWKAQQLVYKIELAMTDACRLCS